MKSLKIFLRIIVISFILFSCRTDDLLTLQDSKSSVLDDLAVSTFTLSEPQNNQNPLLFTASWTSTQFYLSGDVNPGAASPITYVLQIDKAGNEFANPFTLFSTNKLVANVFTKDINQILLNNLKLEAGTPVDLELRILAYYGENQLHSLPSENVLKITISPYKPVDVIPAVYLIGDMNGWNNTSTDFIMYRSSNSKDDYTYTYTGKLAANTYYKFIPEESLGTYKAYCRKDDATMTYEESSGGAFYNQDERYVTINLDTKNLTYSIVDYDATTAKNYSTIGPIGGFCNWDNEPPMSKSSYDAHQWSGSFKIDVSTALKFRGDKNWANNWGANAEEFPYGKAVFDGPGANIAVPATYKIYFNDLTGHYVILQQ